MFNLISNSPLSDVLAPPVTSFEEFLYHWNSFTAFYRQNDHNTQTEKLHIESTNLANKLIKMTEIIITEQLDWMKRKKDSSALCPTIEYILQNNILETLSIVAQTDTPIGICPHILLFFTRFLHDSKITLIPHKSVHSSLNKLIIICGKIPASPYESTEMYFLTSLIKLIKNPDFLHFFSINSFPLINSLLSLLYSEDAEISKYAGDSIIRLIQILDENAAKVIAEDTPFSCKIVDQIIIHYNAIPHSLKPEEIETVNSLLLQEHDSPLFSTSIRKFLSFLKWFIFFDLVIQNLIDNSILKCNLLNEFKKNFLWACFLPDLLGDGFANELDALDNVLRATVLMSNCLRNIENSSLFDLICHFLILSDHNNDKNHSVIIMPEKANKKHLRTILLERCHISDIIQRDFEQEGDRIKFIKLSSATLQLFEDILSRPSFEIINDLVIKQLSAENCQNNVEIIDIDWSMLEKPNIWTKISSKFNSINVLDQMNTVADEIHHLSNIQNQTSYIDLDHMIKILYLFISLMPDELKFDIQQEKSEFEAYLKEAVKGFHMFIITSFIKWNTDQKQKTFNDDACNNDRCNFVKILFNNLNSLLELPYEIKIQLFSILAKISLVPNEYINNCFLNPTILIKNSDESLFNILHKLIENLQISVKGIDNLHDKLYETKMKLLSGKIPDHFYDNNEQETKILQSLIVLNEFCKELSSIIYVKNYTLKLCNEKK
ncbi:FHF complex subunit HOOK interacting protein 2A-like isoform X1 [Dermatophagoides pteronyssinus]|uniref:FHF complex subunit HOOK interacting protein 2A-like isoform X1 n=2 Tax=Dermatophagoides pteronyssinus TaxID=6956 RepID=UPI003F66D20E